MRGPYPEATLKGREDYKDSERTSRRLVSNRARARLQPACLSMCFFDCLRAALLFLKRGVRIIETYHRVTFLQHLVDSDESFESLHLIGENWLHSETSPEGY